eukprot:jgi/Tetstr1/438091/TSEL_026715.t1
MWLRLAEGLLPSVRLELLDHDAARLLQDVCRDAVLALPFGDLSQSRAEIQWLKDTMTAVGVEMHHHHAEPTQMRVGDDNLCAISLGKEDEEFADTLRLAVALTSPVALLRAICLRTIYLAESEFNPSELLTHPFSQRMREAGELGGNTGHNQIRRASIGLRKKVRKTAPASLALRGAGRPIYTLTLQLTAHHHSIIGGTSGTDSTKQWRKTMSTAKSKPRLSGTRDSDSE